MKRFIRTVIVLMIVGSLGAAALPVSAKTIVSKEALSFVYENEDYGNYKIPYRLFVPADYDAGKKYPVLLFLHGAGERGNDNSSQFANAIQTLFTAREKLLKETIVIIPQCPAGEQWVNTSWSNGNYSTDKVKESKSLSTVIKILEKVEEEYSCDTDRVYAFGLSMGGYGTWDLLARHGELFAAAVPICGGGDESKAEALSDIPIWTCHSDKDPIVKFEGTERMYQAISAYGKGKITFTPVASSDHGAAWNAASSNKELIDWLYSQKLSDRIETEPEPEPEPDNTADNTDVKPTEDKKSGLSTGASVAIAASAAAVTAGIAAAVMIKKKKKE